MRQTNFIKAFLLAVFVAGAFLIVRSSVSDPQNTPKKESMDECIQKKAQPTTEKMGWESLPQQFFSSF
jgi:hypothetical protein